MKQSLMLHTFQTLEKYNLSTSQILTLLAIHNNQQTTTAIIQTHGISKTKCQPNLNRLMALKYITRTTEIKHFKYYLTQAGEKLIKEILS